MVVIYLTGIEYDAANPDKSFVYGESTSTTGEKTSLSVYCQKKEKNQVKLKMLGDILDMTPCMKKEAVLVVSGSSQLEWDFFEIRRKALTKDASSESFSGLLVEGWGNTLEVMNRKISDLSTICVKNAGLLSETYKQIAQEMAQNL